jgi:phosphatidylinositol alpha-1,6-mannosyltransferase
MRHALLTEVWFPEIGGSIHLYDHIYREHFPLTDSVHVIAGGNDGDEVHDASYALPVTRFSRKKYEWLKPESALEYARMVSRVLQVLRRERIEVLHCGRVIPEGLVAYGLHQLTGVPYVVWNHGEDVALYLKYPVKKKLMRQIFQSARGVLANSSFTRATVQIAGAPSDKLHVVNPAVDADAFAGPFETQNLVERWGLAGKRVLLTVGRLTRRKGHDHVLQALARLKRPDVVYLVLSDGELEDELKALSNELGLQDVVRWVGPVARDDVARYYHVCDVFVMANRTLSDDDCEGFGMVFLEASAAGKAVLGGRSGGTVDAISHGVSGLLVDASSVDLVTEAIKTLLDDDALRRRLGEQGRAWARGFSWERAARRVRAIAAGEPLTPEHAEDRRANGALPEDTP